MHRHTAHCAHPPRLRGWWPANLRVIRTTIAGVPPLVAGVIGAIDSAYSHGLAGRSGKIRAGEPSDPSYRFSGYLAYDPARAIPPGASATLRRDPATLLPATRGEVRTVPGTVQEHLANLTPAGWRR